MAQWREKMSIELDKLTKQAISQKPDFWEIARAAGVIQKIAREQAQQ